MTLGPETLDKLKRVSTATLATALYKRGPRSQMIQDVRPLRPMQGSMVGEAFTVRSIPALIPSARRRRKARRAP
jgi:regulator of RNase E activity RraA